MTEKQQKFADEYIISLNATQAYKTAYPSVKKNSTAKSAGSRMLTNVNVRKYIDKRMEELKSEKVADQREIMEYLTSVMRGETREQVLISRGEMGQAITEMDLAGKDRIKAAELLGKHFRMWTDKVEADITGTVVFLNESEIRD